MSIIRRETTISIWDDGGYRGQLEVWVSADAQSVGWNWTGDDQLYTPSLMVPLVDLCTIQTCELPGIEMTDAVRLRLRDWARRMYRSAQDVGELPWT